MRFYHFTSWLPGNLILDFVYETNWEQSHYWGQKAQLFAAIERDSTFEQMATTIRNLPFKVPDVEQTTQNAILQKRQLELTKEFQFEQVRQIEFPNKPSRMRCMFLLPSTVDPRAYLRGMGFQEAGKTILEIETADDANLHLATFSLLNCNTLPPDGQIEQARQYWSESDTIPEETEVLFEGKFKIVKILV